MLDQNSASLREECARKLLATTERPSPFTAFVGLDGFVDEIIHVVDKRMDAAHYERLPTIAKLAERLAGAAGKSTNIELVNQRTKLGGNGPIMADALAALGLKVTYLGNLGYPAVHPVFSDFCRRAEVYSIAEPSHTDALEFEDGKIMMGKITSLTEITWENVLGRFGRDKLRSYFGQTDLVAFVNWTMIPHMSRIWENLLLELCPQFSGARRKIFFDLADPEKRPKKDIGYALNLITQFQRHFDVILGVNEKEAIEIGNVLGVKTADRTAEGLVQLAREIRRQLEIDTLAMHPVTYALAANERQVDLISGPYVPHPLITTGAGDHFNAGFCLGKLCGFSNALCVLIGVATSGYYVRTARTPTVPDLVAWLREWPSR